ncbi:MAG: phage tail protein [Flavobacterium sp.]|uniref:phage tail protein n=1 Tax=Flavobacterium sp. TaxID=239 RepID=UPI0026108683|nr:phage tail protein [Flavobacterium sp.]MDD5151795.1 phage tail protein [Flavobacterium sp.]
MKQNYNLATSTNFRFEVTPPGFDPEEKINFFIQNVDLPSITLSPASPSNFINNKIAIPGDTIEYDDLIFTFLVSEDYNNYIAIYDWLQGMKNHEDENHTKYMSDCNLHILSNNKSPNLVITFFGCFPTNLGNISFDSTSIDPIPLTCPITFKYQYFKIKKLVEIV